MRTKAREAALNIVYAQQFNTDCLDALKKKIFKPCNMIDTTFILNDEQRQRFIDMHNKEKDQRELQKGKGNNR